MPLSKETQERIEIQASNNCDNFNNGSSCDEGSFSRSLYETAKRNYIKGASEEAERAQLLEEALEKIEETWDGRQDNLSQRIAINRMIQVSKMALHKYRNNLK